MANYVPSNLVKAQARLLSAFQNSELRYREPATFREFLRQTSIMVPDHVALRGREDRAISAYFKNRTQRSLGSGRSHNHTGPKGDSTEMPITWTTYNDEFSISMKQGDNNMFGYEEQLDNELENVIGNFAEGFESAAVSHLFTNRSGVNIATVEGAFDATDDVFDITEATNGDRALQITKSIMDINKYRGQYTVFCDTVSFNKFQFQANQGSGNTANLTFQFGGATYVHSPDLNALAAGLSTPRTKGFWIAVPVGTIAVLPWIPIQNRQGRDFGNEGIYGSLINPVDGLDYASHIWFEGADETASNGYTQDILFQHEISIDLAFENAPLTNANETTLQAFALI